jgi:SAM-dependent methyltransferase
MTISDTMGRCRNCGEAGNLQELGFIGEVAPFFLKRVFGVRLGKVRSSSPWKQMVRRVAGMALGVLERASRPVALVEIELCESCGFVQTKLPFDEGAINRLYVDYREGSYNRERIEYEPGYGTIAADVGHGAVELEARLSAAAKFLTNRVAVDEGFTILDFGGSDGKFMPRLEGEKFVFEISNVEPIEGVTRIKLGEELGTYSLVQLAHVIEHVVQPLELVKYVATLVAPGGYLYVETPREISGEEREQLKLGRRTVGIHEHINSYGVEAVTKLIEGAGLRLVAIEATGVDVGWAKAVHIRALGRKD